MRTREEVEKEQRYAPGMSVQDRSQTLALEVLLDIRDLLSQEKEMRVCGHKKETVNQVTFCQKVNCKEHNQD